MSDTTRPDLAALEALEAKATPAPWSSDWYGTAGVFEDGKGHIPPGQCGFCGNETLTLVAELPVKEGEFSISGIVRKHVHKGPSDDWHEITNFQGIQVTGNYDYEQGGVCSAEDSALISAARNALPDLIRTIRQQDAEIAKLKGENAELVKDRERQEKP